MNTFQRIKTEVAPFPYQDKGKCFSVQEMYEKIHRLMRQGHRGCGLQDRLCKWLGDGRVALQSMKGGWRVVVRELVDGLIKWHEYPADCFPHVVPFPKSEAEMTKERTQIRRKLGLKKPKEKEVGQHGADEEEEETQRGEEEEEHEELKNISGIKYASLPQLMLNSLWARKFDKTAFNPRPDAMFLTTESAKGYDPFSPQALTRHTFTGFRWSREELEGMKARGEFDGTEELVQKLDQNLLEVMCRNNLRTYDYVVKWYLHVYLHPETPLHTMLLFLGQQGCGKTSTSEMFAPIFGNHYRNIADVKDLVGNFTATAKDTILAFLNEAKVKRNSNAANQLKILISDTNRCLRVREMYHDTAYVENFLNIAGATDNLWDFGMDLQGRRFYIVPFSDCRQNDGVYFEGLSRAIRDQDYLGLRAWLHSKLETDLSGFHRGRIPEADKNEIAKLIAGEFRCLNPVDSFMDICTDRGYILEAPADCIDVNHGKRWRDPYGRTPETEKKAWVAELQYVAVCEEAKRLVPLCRNMNRPELLSGLRKFLKEGCEEPMRKQVTVYARSHGQLVVKHPKPLYIVFKSQEECTKILGFKDVDPDDHQDDGSQPCESRKRPREDALSTASSKRRSVEGQGDLVRDKGKEKLSAAAALVQRIEEASGEQAAREVALEAFSHKGWRRLYYEVDRELGAGLDVDDAPVHEAVESLLRLVVQVRHRTSVSVVSASE